MIFEEKKLLKESIDRVDPDRLGRLFHIATKCAGQAEENYDVEMECDIADPDSLMAREMEA